jgi:hypothetical protein
VPDGAARKYQRDTGRKIQFDQGSDIGAANPEFVAQQRRDCGRALELVPWWRDRATRLSIAADICCDHAEIGIVARFT